MAYAANTGDGKESTEHGRGQRSILEMIQEIIEVVFPLAPKGPQATGDIREPFLATQAQKTTVDNHPLLKAIKEFNSSFRAIEKGVDKLLKHEEAGTVRRSTEINRRIKDRKKRCVQAAETQIKETRDFLKSKKIQDLLKQHAHGDLKEIGVRASQLLDLLDMLNHHDKFNVSDSATKYLFYLGAFIETDNPQAGKRNYDRAIACQLLRLVAFDHAETTKTTLPEDLKESEMEARTREQFKQDISSILTDPSHQARDERKGEASPLDDGRTPLLRAAENGGSTAELQGLIDKIKEQGRSVDEDRTSGASASASTALGLAAMNKHTEHARLLLENDADPYIANRRYASPATYAAACGAKDDLYPLFSEYLPTEDLCKQAYDMIAPPDTDGTEPLHNFLSNTAKLIAMNLKEQGGEPTDGSFYTTLMAKIFTNDLLRKELNLVNTGTASLRQTLGVLQDLFTGPENSAQVPSRLEELRRDYAQRSRNLIREYAKDPGYALEFVSAAGGGGAAEASNSPNP